MRNKKIGRDDYNESVFASEQAFGQRFRRLEGDELEALKHRVAGAASERKSRVTIYFDSDIVRRFKEIGESEGVGYQTLMNQALRIFVDGISADIAKQDIKNDILKDKKFLKRLKTVLTA